ncbi:hypothetical protein ACFL6U_08735 [Planctomycetota bacterium]
MKSHILLSICLSLLLAGLVSAQTNWTGAIDELWSNPDNWSNGLPTTTTSQTRIMQADAVCIVDVPVDVFTMRVDNGHLRIVDGGELNAPTGYLYYGWVAGYEGLVEVLGGVVNANWNTAVGQLGSATLIIDYEGVYNQHDQWISLGNNTNGAGVVELRGGLLNITSGFAESLRFAPGAGATASMDFSGGTLMQTFSDARLANINDNIANGAITAYGKKDGEDGHRVIAEQIKGDLVVKGLHPLNPVPEDGSHANNGTLTLEWTVEAGMQVNVWFTDDEAKIYAGDLDAQVVAKQAVTSVQVMAEKDTRYFWAVDVDKNADGVINGSEYGAVFDFLAENIAPEVDAGDDVTTWLTDGIAEVALAGTVTDTDPTTTLWTIVSQPDDPNSPAAVIADPAALNTTITCSALGEYVLQLEANDGEKTSQDTLTISVYSSPCEASKSLDEWELTPGDLNGDCIVDDLDMAILLENWGDCTALECPDPNALQ